MRVLIAMSPEGDMEVVTDGPAEVIVVNDHVPHDRLYRMSAAHTVSAERVAEILGADDIGHAGDARHAAIEHRILSALDGAPHLRPAE